MKKKWNVSCGSNSHRIKKLLRTMKLTIFAFFLGLMGLSASTYSQSGILSLEMKNVSIIDIFEKIESQTEFVFIYKNDAVDLGKRYNIEIKGSDIETILNEIFRDSKTKFEIKDRQIIITQKKTNIEAKPAELIKTDETNQQLKEKEISGIVNDVKGLALPGVSVIVKGTTIGTITDVNGEFRFAIPLDAETIIFSFVGMKTQEIAIANQTSFKITMEEDVIGMEEVVVTAIGIERDEKALGYSVSSVKSDQIDDNNVNLLSSLQGKVTGVNITSLSNDPGASVLMNIRGATSLDISNSSQNSQPLYIIDGIPVTTELNFIDRVDVGNAISDLNPNDIESITILKGASAAALYGSAAGNGVIMITTKTGNKQKKGISIEYNLSSLASTAFNTIELQKEFAGGDRDTYIYSDVDNGWGPSLSDGGITGKRWNMKTQEWETDALLTSTREDRVKEFLRTGLTLVNNVTIVSNKNDEVFRLSYNNTRNRGVVPNTNIYKNSVSFTGMKKVHKNLTVSVKASYLHSFTPNRAITTGSNEEDNVMSILYNMANQIQPISYMKNYWLSEGDGIYPNPVMFDGDDADYKNPYWVANEHINTITKNWTFGRIQADWQILAPLSLTFRSGIDLNSFRYESHTAWGYSDDPNGNYNLTLQNNFTSNTDIILNFVKEFNKFSLNANVGYTYQYINETYTSLSASALSRPNDYNISNASSGTDSESSSWDKNLKQSIFGTAQLGYNRMGYIEVTGRKDWGGILEEDKNSYFYPSASLSLIPSTIFELPSWVNFAKLRIGIAQVGHGIGTPRSTDSYSFKSYDWGNATLVNIGGTLVDSSLKPEKTNSIEFGTDLNLFKNRVKADFTIFKKSHINQLLSVSIPATSGFSSMKTNVGDVVSKGYEWNLSWVPVQNKSFSWLFSTNFSKAEATIDRLSSKFGDYEIIGSEGYLQYKLAKGEKIGNMYQKYQPVLVKEGKYKGMNIIRWDNGEGFERTTDGDAKACIGNYNPDFIMGFNTNIKYKNWTLNIVANLRYGGEYVSRTLGYLASTGFLPETLKGQTRYSSGWVGGRNAAYGGYEWLDSGSGTNSVVNARLSDLGRSDINDAVYLVGVYVDPDSGLDYDNDNAGDENYILNGEAPNATLWSTSEDAAYDWIFKFAQNRTLDATNFKIKEVSLTYQFNKEITQRIKLQKLSISLIARNIFHWYASGFNEDPETAFSIADGYFNQGTSRFTLPPVASWGFQLNVGL